MSNQKGIQSCLHFEKEGYNFVQHTKFFLLEQLIETENISKATLKFRLKQREDFWILKLDTLTPKVLNQGLLLQSRFCYSMQQARSL